MVLASESVFEKQMEQQKMWTSMGSMPGMETLTSNAEAVQYRAWAMS